MIDRNDVLDALTMLTGNDTQHTPDPAEITVLAWVDHFCQFPRLTRDDLFAAVRRYCNEPRERLVQPQDVSRVAVALTSERAAIEGEPEKENNEAWQNLCREALSDAKAGDAGALAWLVSEFDYYGKCIVKWATVRGIAWQRVTALSGGPVSGERGGIGTGVGWEKTRRRRMPDHLIPERQRDALDKELRKLLTEDERYLVLGDMV
jgi:hypothetical protein